MLYKKKTYAFNRTKGQPIYNPGRAPSAETHLPRDPRCTTSPPAYLPPSRSVSDGRLHPTDPRTVYYSK